MKRTVIYARVSTEDQVEKYGLPVQLRACREYAQKTGLTIIAEIADEGISGTILERAGLSKVRAMARAGELDAVVMLDVDRLSRELSHLLILKPEIEKKASLEFVAAKFEDSPSGRMFFSIRGVIGQYERELTRERTMRGRKERALAGLIVGGRVAYGYVYQSGKLIEDPERAPIARRIFADYEAGVSIRGIATRLRAAGAPTWGKGRWAKSSVARILANETYAGVAHYGTNRREGKLIRRRENISERIAVTVPALVTREQWERVQSRLSANPQVGRPSSSYLLRGILHCSHCGRKMIGEGGRSRSYRCTGRDRMLATEPCLNHVRTSVLDAAAWNSLLRKFTNGDFLRAALATHEAGLREVDPGKIDELRKLAAKLRRKEDLAMSAMLDPDLAESRAELKAQYKATVEARRNAETEATALEGAKSSAPSAAWIEKTAVAIRRFTASLTDPQLKQEFVRRLVNRAEWNGEEIRMTCYLSRNWPDHQYVASFSNSLQVVVIERVAA